MSRPSSAFQGFDQINVALPCLRGGLAFQCGPGVPLGSLDHLGERWPLACDVARTALFVKRVQPQQGRCVGFLGQTFGIGSGLLEKSIEVCHGSSLEKGRRDALGGVSQQ